MGVRASRSAVLARIAPHLGAVLARATTARGRSSQVRPGTEPLICRAGGMAARYRSGYLLSGGVERSLTQKPWRPGRPSPGIGPHPKLILAGGDATGEGRGRRSEFKPPLDSRPALSG
jgi:hypothetical protein